MVVRTIENTAIHLSEIDMVIVESTAVFMSSYLLSELSLAKIPVVFCDAKHNPVGQYVSLYGSHDTSRRVKEQANWCQLNKDVLWQKIVQSKICNQARNLEYQGLTQASALWEFASQVELGDKTNREGHAAKVYFNALFGKDFSRNLENGINARLDYGYAILMAWMNREIVSRGYVTQLGISHRNDFNNFNLGCDFMEPFRPLIDQYVLLDIEGSLTKEVRQEVIRLFDTHHSFNGGNYHLTSVFSLYVKTNLGILSGRIDPNEYMDFILCEYDL
jgi:CRISPR-associated protein Cas1